MEAACKHAIAIIGAGPFGVSIAAHLAAGGLDFRIFGKPMYRWRCQMPAGMCLKSEGCASSLSDPARHFTLARYCEENTLSYGPWGKPVSLDVYSRDCGSFPFLYAPLASRPGCDV